MQILVLMEFSSWYRIWEKRGTIALYCLWATANCMRWVCFLS